MNDREEVEALIRAHGGVLVRSRKHRVYKFPDGRTFTLSSTPSDSIHAERNNLSDLRHFLGIRREIRKNPDRKPKSHGKAPRRRYVVPLAPVPVPDWKQKLSGLIQFCRESWRQSVAPTQIPGPVCVPVHLERLPRTPLFAILMHLFPLRERSL